MKIELLGKRRAVALLLMVFSAAAAFGAPADGDLREAQYLVAKFRESDARSAERLMDALKRAEGQGVQPKQDLDVIRYDLDLTVDPGEKSVSGVVTMSFSPTKSLGTLKMRLRNNMKVTATGLDSAAVKAGRKGSDIVFKLSPPLVAGSVHEVYVSYEGSPKLTGDLDGGMLFSTHDGTPSATTLSEPFESYSWWPCVEDVTDKFIADIHLTVPPGMVGASNGLLVSTTAVQDGWTRYDWRESYPISNYLVAVNVTNYSTFSQSYTSLDGAVTMPIENYVYPEDLTAAKRNFQRVPRMIEKYAQLCGEYPFLDEKYGMVAFPWGGAMEHQTLTSMGDMLIGGSYDYDLIYAHELAHQWWGDEVTCGTWNDIWLNEGFATYFEVLWGVSHYGITEGRLMGEYYDDGLYNGYLGGQVYVKNGNRPFNDTGAIYEKGGWVLHMLKRVMGEEDFYRALSVYRAAHTFSNATTADFMAVCEEVFGGSLKWFFDQWVYTKKRPIYSVNFSQSGGDLTVTIEQKQKHKIANRTTDRDVYIMPVDLTIFYDDGSEDYATVNNDSRVQNFIFKANGRAVSVAIDEENWILKVVQ